MANGNLCPHCGREIPPDIVPVELCPHCGSPLGDQRDQKTERKRSKPTGAFASQDQNLLFGVLAIQLRFITGEQFVTAAAAWATDPTTPLWDRMVDGGLLTREDFELVNSVVRRAIEDHGGNLAVTLRESNAEGNLLGHVTIHGDSGVVVDLLSDEHIELLDESPGRYTRTSEYSRGGMGRILLVHDQYLDRDIAMKELLPPPDGDSAKLEGESPVKTASRATVRFLREARVTGQLEHPSIVPVYEVGRRPNGTLYYTMKLVRGRTLGRALQQTKTLAERLSYLSHFLGLCHAMAYAHDRNVVHRDIKPSNIMVGDFGETVVIDWGLAKVLGRTDEDEAALAKTWTELYGRPHGAAEQTADGMRLGTPQYMAPEQVAGRIGDIDPRTDVFALGIVLYQILTGDIPFNATGSHSIYDQITNLNFTPVGEAAPDVPPELASICSRAMERQRDDRYQSAKEFAEEIQRFLAGAVVQSYNYTPLELARNVYRRHRSVVNTAAAAAAILLVLGTVSYINIYRSRNAAVEARNRETIAKVAEAESREAAEASNYVTEIRLAQSLIQESNYQRSRDVLWATDPRRRRWEWGMLLAKAHPELYSLDGYQGFAISPNGRQIARAYRSKPIQIHDAKNGSLSRELPVDQDSAIFDLKFSPDSSLLIAVTSRSTLRIWDTNTWQSIAPPALHDGKVNDVRFLRNGQLLTCGQESAVKIWDSRSGEEIQSLTTNHDEVNLIQASADGRQILTGRFGGDLQLWDVDSGSQLAAISQAEILGPENIDTETYRWPILSPSGKHVAMAVGDRVRLFAAEAPETVRTLVGNHSRIVSIQFDSIGERLLVGGSEGSAVVWDTASGKKEHVIGIRSHLLKSIWSPNGEFVCTHPVSGAPQVWRLNASSVALVNQLGKHRHITPSIQFSPDSDRIITADGIGTMKVWSALASPYQSIVAATGEPYVRVAANADSSRVAMLLGRHSLVVIDRPRNEPLVDLTLPSDLASRTPHAAIGPSGRFVVATLDPFEPIVVDIDSETITARYLGHASQINAVAISPNESRVITGGWDGSLHVWDPQTGNQQISIEHGSEITELAVRQDNEVAVGSTDGDVVLYDLQTGQLKQRLIGVASRISALRWSPDGVVLAAGLADGRIAVWTEVGTGDGQRATVIGKHISSVRTLDFVGPRRLLSFSRSDLRVFDVQSGDEIFSTNDGAEDVIRISSDGELLSCNRGLVFHWDSVGAIVRSSQLGETVEKQQQKFDQFRRQKLSESVAQYPLDSGDRQLVLATRDLAIAALTQLSEILVEAVDPDRRGGDDPTAGNTGLIILAGPTAEAVKGLGVRAKDRITRIANLPVTSAATSAAAIESAVAALAAATDQLEVDVVRGGVIKQLEIALIPLTESSLEFTLQRETAIDILRRLDQGYRQLLPDEESRSRSVDLDTEYAAQDRQRYLAAKLSPSDRIVGFNGQAIENFEQLLAAFDDFLPDIATGSSSEFSFDVQRGTFQKVHLVFALE